MCSASKSPRERFRNINNFAVYYGNGKEDSLSKFDMIVVEPGHYNENKLKEIRKNGSLAIAYISVMEVHKLIPGYEYLKEDDFLYVNGERVVNKEYGTDLVNLRSKRWVSLLTHHIGNLIFNNGYDGIFLDTIGDVEFRCIPAQDQDILISAAVNFVKEIRELFASQIIVQNNGLEKLHTLTSKYIDGVCWENPPIDKMECSDWINMTIKQLSFLQKSENIRTLVLIEESGGEEVNSSYALRKKIEEIARENNFLFHIASFRYID